MVVQIYGPGGKIVGFVEGDTYYRVIDYRKGQMFMHPKYHNAIAISVSILKQLARLGVKKFSFWIEGLEKKPFRVIITFSEFLMHSKEVFFEGKLNADRQRICPLKYWHRVSEGQKSLEEVPKE